MFMIRIKTKRLKTNTSCFTKMVHQGYKWDAKQSSYIYLYREANSGQFTVSVWLFLVKLMMVIHLRVAVPGVAKGRIFFGKKILWPLSQASYNWEASCKKARCEREWPNDLRTHERDERPPVFGTPDCWCEFGVRQPDNWVLFLSLQYMFAGNCYRQGDKRRSLFCMSFPPEYGKFRHSPF